MSISTEFYPVFTDTKNATAHEGAVGRYIQKITGFVRYTQPYGFVEYKSKKAQNPRNSSSINRNMFGQMTIEQRRLAILKVCQSEPRMSREIMAVANVSKSRLYVDLRELQKNGMLVRTGTEKHRYYWMATAEGLRAFGIRS